MPHGSLENIVSADPARLEVALALVPELLEEGTSGSVSVALDVIEAAGPRAEHLVPMLQACRDGALPSWRARFESALGYIEGW